MENVNFEPWVGEYYGKPDSIFNKKLMVLGASHYCSEGDTCNDCPHYGEGCRKFTSDTVEEFLCDGNGNWKSTYTKFESSLLKRGLNLEERKRTWNSLLFCNFYQTAVPERCKFKNFSEKDKDVARLAFMEILSEYRPDVVIVWGQKIYDSLPSGGNEAKKLFADNGVTFSTWKYTLPNGHEVNVMFTYHPSSSRHSWSFWGDLINQFFVNNEVVLKEN